MIKSLKTIAIALLAAGATAPTLYAAPVVDASTNLFQPLTVALSVYQQKSISSAADTIQTGPAASFKTANLITAVTNTLGTNSAGAAFSKGAAVGYVIIGTNTAPVLDTNSPIYNTLSSNVPVPVDLSSSVIPLTLVTNYTTTTNTVYTITNALDGNGDDGIATNGVADTSTTLVGTGSGANGVTNTLAIGGSSSNNISITVSNGITNITVVSGGATNVYTNLSDIALSGTNASVGTNDYEVGVGASLNITNSVGEFTNQLVIETNGGVAAHLFIGTNSFSVGTNVVVDTNSVTNVNVTVTVGQRSFVISTNSVGDTNGTTNITTLVETVGGINPTTNTYVDTNALTNLVLINGYVIVSNGVTSGFGTNQTLTGDLSDTVGFQDSSTNFLVTNYETTNYTVTNLGVTNEIIITNEIITSNAVAETDAILGTGTISYTATNYQVLAGYNTTNEEVPSGPAQLVVAEKSGSGATAGYIYTVIPPSVLSISNTPVTNDIISATFKSTTTNQTDYSIQTLTLTATNVSMTLQGFVHSTLSYVPVASATLTGKKTAVEKEAWSFINGYGTNSGAPILLTGTAAVGAPATQKVPEAP